MLHLIITNVTQTSLLVLLVVRFVIVVVVVVVVVVVTAAAAAVNVAKMSPLNLKKKIKKKLT